VSVRHHFSAVPKWKSRGLIGLVLAGALIGEALVASGPATAAPPAPPSQEEPTRGPNGLEAPDIATAQTIARLQEEPVEVVGERTETSSTWALPDGTLSTGLASGPIWVRRGGDGTQSGDWAPVDLTLETTSEGTIRPKAHPADLVLAGAGTPEDGALVSMDGPSGEVVGLEWPDRLPEPRLEGPRAVYPDVQEGVDLVVEATRTGYEQYFVLTERPEPGQAPDLSLTVTGEGLAVEADAEGHVEFTSPDGQVVGSSGTPLVWDAVLDEERRHPVTEPWASEGEQAGVALPPLPDWTEESEQPGTPPRSGPPAAPAPGSNAEAAPGEDAGRTQSPQASAAGGSVALPLPEAAAAVGPGEVELTLAPDEEYLAHPETEYPVVVDPEYHWLWGFDTWVQTGFSSDQSGSTELRLGTFDGGASVARSFIHFDFSDIRYKTILGASLSLWEWHSWSCAPRTWEIWETGLASPGTRINAQPPWIVRGAVSSDTKGASASCEDGWVGADVTTLVQHWSNNGAGEVGLGLKAYDERDNYAWKKFHSADAGAYVPAIFVRWNTPPGPASGLVVGNSQDNGAAGGIWTSSATPQLSATAQDADAGSQVNMTFAVHNATTGAKVWEGVATNVTGGQVGSVNVPAGKLANGGQYRFQVTSHDGVQANTAPSAWVPFTVDTTAPAAPLVTSPDYPSDGEWYKAENQAGTFALAMPAADPTLAGYEWGLDKTPDTRLNATGSTTLAVTPTTQGRHVLQVRSIDKAGSRSAIVSFVFYVGLAGLTSPLEGAEVVRRVRLTVEGKDDFSHVKFRWRRGPDAATSQDIALAVLSRADGETLDSEWTSLSDLGDFATWDAGATLGHVPGPVQVQAVLATNSSGAGAYATAWTTVTVSPDADNAATDAVGPGSVNLLTGDYAVSSTDVDEFGLSLGRSASSRDPRAGLEPQAELLTEPQRSISSLTGWCGYAAGINRVVSRGHTGMDALRVAATGASGNSFAYPSADCVEKSGMVGGKTYRVSGWVYVPSSTGLNPLSNSGLRIVAFYQEGSSYTQVSTSRPTVTDAWQHLSVDVTIPVGSAHTFIRLYNGFQAAGKDVFFDDLSVREIWSPLGPQWSLGSADEIAGTAYTHISQPYPDVATLHLSGGGEIWFTESAGNEIWWPEPGAESLTLKRKGDGQWQLTELDGTVSEFVRQAGAVNSQLVTTSPPAASGKTRLVYENVNGRVRLQRMIAPVEAGVDNWPSNAQACTGGIPAVGCEVVQLVYSSSTTATATSFGSYGDRLSEVRLWSTAPGATQTDAITAARYAYDDKGRLREVWDPRIAPSLKTTYEYDADGRVTQMTPPGELPWKFQYGTGGSRASVGNGDLVDRSSGRLLRVSRASLAPGTLDQTGPDTTTTIVYAVPLTRAAGGPYDLDPDALATWAQRTGPTDATAIFGPEDVPSVTTADATTPGRDGYRAAMVHYLDASGREVNTATPSGPDAPAAGFIDTAEYDQYGNVVRALDATNRLLALDQMPSSAADLAQLNLTQTDTATRAMLLSSVSTYGPEGLDLLRSRGPLVRLAIGNDPNNVQLVHDLTTYAYDEGKPDGVAYHLVTTKTDATLVAGSSPEQQVDVVVTEYGYSPIDGALPTDPTSGWRVRQTTTVTVDAGGTDARVSAAVRYDAQGRPVESRKPGSSGTDAGTTRTAYYSAGPNSDRAECGNKPAYAGLPCTTWAAAAVTLHDAARMATQLPIRTITAYNRYGSPTSITESATGPVDGVTVTQERTTTVTYDAAGRVLSAATAAVGAGTTVAALPRSENTFDPNTGRVIRMAAVDPATGSVLSTVAKTFDRLGRLVRYEDANGGWTSTVFDQFGKPVEVTNSIGTTTEYVYDRTKEPRGFVTSVTDSVAGTISASYGPDGQLISQTLPGWVRLHVGYDANRAPVSRTYERLTDGAVIASSVVVENSSGQWVTHTTAASSKQFAYDRLGRLTDVRDTTVGTGTCTWRQYTFNERAGRTSLETSAAPTDGCIDPDDPSAPGLTEVAYTYDSADRLVTETSSTPAAWVYDPLGRITAAPVRGVPGAQVVNGYYANDKIAAQTINGVSRQTWSLDPLGRFSSSTSEEWADDAWHEAVTQVLHYGSDSDSPAWIVEDASAPDDISRYITGLDGSLAIQTGKTGERILQLTDLHGGVMTTLPIADGQDVATWSEIRHFAADEYGNPTDLTTGDATVSDGSPPGRDGRYRWLGGAQRSADATAGVVLMGARLYDPSTGRFWSRDPLPGGNATEYDYCSADPVNCTDLNGMKSKKKAKKQAAMGIARVMSAAGLMLLPKSVAKAAASRLTPQMILATLSDQWVADRFARNAPFTAIGLELGSLTGGPGSCGLREGLMYVCRVPSWVVPEGRSGFTIGNTFITSRDTVSPALLRHEARHADQWAIFGGLYPELYVRAELKASQSGSGGQSACFNYFEVWANLDEGEYRC
jgi:RHS repeat-associated protein